MTIASDDGNSDLTTSDCAQTQAANGQSSTHNTASNRMRRFSDDFLLMDMCKLLLVPMICSHPLATASGSVPAPHQSGPSLMAHDLVPIVVRRKARVCFASDVRNQISVRRSICR